METNSPVLQVGQVWSFQIKDMDLAIVGLSKHLAEVRHCRDGKLIRIGPTDLQSIRVVQSLISNGGARLTGHLVMPDGIVEMRAPPPRSLRKAPG